MPQEVHMRSTRFILIFYGAIALGLGPLERDATRYLEAQRDPRTAP